jgi:hypothetical protein
MITAALLPGAAVFVPAAHACTLLQPESPVQFVAESELIVVGRVTEVGADSFSIQPEAFLKGPVSGEALRFSGRDAQCPTAEVAAEDRVLVYVGKADELSWPLINQVYEFREGRAYREGEMERLEIQVISDIRRITGQYGVPAIDDDEGAGINWGDTLLPLGALLVVVFVIGLVLMRIWHRIDPS